MGVNSEKRPAGKSSLRLADPHQRVAGSVVDAPSSDGDRYRAPALEKGLDILELLAEQTNGLTRAEITKMLERSANEIYRMLERLVARQYVTRSPEGDRYSLSLKLYALAHRHPPLNRLISEALPVMQRFANQTEQSCHLAVFAQGNLLVIAQVDGPGVWGLSVRLGARIGLIDTSSGHVMLTFQTAERRANMLSEHTKVKGEVKLDQTMLERAYEQIRQNGYSSGESLQSFGVTDVTFPILGSSGEAIAALTCPYIRRIDEYVAPSLDISTAMLKESASALSLSRGTADSGSVSSGVKFT